jgi:LAGLIDADG endonuclease
VGSRSNEHIAYIAGFLDGDGSLMLQVKKRGDSSRGLRFMATICLYQDTRHDEHLHWMKEFLGAGYISVRNDGMTELRIQGYKTVLHTLSKLKPYLRFKAVQCEALMQACMLLIQTPLKQMTDDDLKKIVSCILKIQSMNYITKKKRSKEELYDLLGLTP